MKKKVVLLIMETGAQLDHFKKNLEANEFKVVTAHNGETGFEIARELEPDIILAATQLEKLDGIDLCFMIRQNSRLSSIPYLLIADDGNPEVRINGFRSGVDAIILTNISMRELTTRIETLIKRYEFLTRQILKSNQSLIGKLNDFRLIEILQMLNLNQKTGILRISSQNLEGEIVFYDGKITRAKLSDVEGENAVQKMVFWDDGFFIFEQDLIQSDQNVHKPTMQLILDCCQLLDESKINDESALKRL